MDTPKQRTVFFVSDGTGITAETLGHSLLTQFPEIEFRRIRMPFVESPDKARECAARIQLAGNLDGTPPIVFSTLVDGEVKEILRGAGALFLDLFEKFIGPLEKELGLKSTHTVGRFHGVADNLNYQQRIEAINYALSHDDGVTDADLEQADVILVGVSRSGKTPTSLYLAMQFCLKAANYPLIPEDFERNKLPGNLQRFRGKLFGLTISPTRLAQIRQERRPDSRYASLENCRYEVDAAIKLMKREGIRWLDSTAKSIEEISSQIVQDLKVVRDLY